MANTHSRIIINFTHILPQTDRIFLLLLGETSEVLCTTCYLFLKNFDSILTRIRPGFGLQKSFGLIFFPVFIWLYSTRVICQNVIIKTIWGSSSSIYTNWHVSGALLLTIFGIFLKKIFFKFNFCPPIIDR